MCVFNDIYTLIFTILSFYDYDNTGNRFEIFSPIHFINDYLIFDRTTITENYIINNIISNKESFFE